jgi:tRNA/rRNA methyltransferase
LEEVGFLDPKHPKKLVPRMRHMFARNAMSHDEVDMMRGLCTAMIKTARKA